MRGIAFTHFNSADVVRHPLVARIVDAYEIGRARPSARRSRPLSAMPPKNKLTLSRAVCRPARSQRTWHAPTLRRWVQAALLAPAELTMRFVDAEEGRALNRDYRGKDYATNVLTFAYTEERGTPTSRPRPTSSCAPTCWRRKRPNRA